MTTLQITLPDEVKEKVSQVAARQHISLQDFLSMALMEKLSTIPDPELEKRAARGKRVDFDALLAQFLDVPPEDYDRIK